MNRFPPRLPLLLRCLAAAVLAASACGHGSDHELIDAATREIVARPGEAAPWLRRAFLHLEHGDWHSCLRDADEAAKRAAGHEATVLRGRALAAGGLHAAAKVELDRVLAAQPADAVALAERARVNAALGERQAAADDAARAMKHTREPEADQVFAAVAHLCAAQREIEALAVIDAVLKTKPGLPVLVERAAQIEAALGRHDAAVRRWDEAIARTRVKEPLMAKRAALLAQAGRTRESIDAWRALDAHVAALPAAARGSHAMSQLAAQAHRALAALTALER